MTDEDRRFLKGLYELHPDSPQQDDDEIVFPDNESELPAQVTPTTPADFEPSKSEPETDEEWEEYFRDLERMSND